MNPNKEWKFIQREIHAEKPTRKNAMKREVLFTLQILLPEASNEKDAMIYRKTKEFYLRLS